MKDEQYKKEVESSLIHEGDSITISLSADVKVNRTSTWVGVKATTTVKKDETDIRARRRVLDFAQETFDKHVHETVELITEMQGETKR